MSFDTFGLSKEILRAVQNQGYTAPTEIQSQVIPLILEQKDILAGAQTGTGKTASFMLPLLNLLQKKSSKKPRALILVPTRELASQVYDNALNYGKYLQLKSAAVFGGVAIGPQKMKFRKGVDIIVATPGRLIDHMTQNTVDLSSIEMLVLDEADCMLDMGFIHDIRKIMSSLPTKRQTLLFSATFTNQIEQLAEDFLNEPETVLVAKKNAVSDQVKHVVYPVDRARKSELLYELITSQNWDQALIFTRTKHGANRLCERLNKDDIASDAIHGDKRQAARTKALAKFKKGKTRILVATDVAARGIDIQNLPYVVNYELPYVPSDYVHRIGRTGRAGKEGEAVSLVSKDELRLMRDIEKLLKKDLVQVTVPGFEVNFNKPAAKRKGGKRPFSSRSKEDRGDRFDSRKPREGRNNKFGFSKEGRGDRFDSRKPREGRDNKFGFSKEGRGDRFDAPRKPREGRDNKFSFSKEEKGDRFDSRKPKFGRDNKFGSQKQDKDNKFSSRKNKFSSHKNKSNSHSKQRTFKGPKKANLSR